MERPRWALLVRMAAWKAWHVSWVRGHEGWGPGTTVEPAAPPPAARLGSAVSCPHRILVAVDGLPLPLTFATSSLYSSHLRPSLDAVGRQVKAEAVAGVR